MTEALNRLRVVPAQLHPYSIDIQIISRGRLKKTKVDKDLLPILKVNCFQNENIKDIINKTEIKQHKNRHVKAYAYDASLFEQFSFQRMVQYYYNKENTKFFANKDQQHFYQLQEQEIPSYLLQFFPGRMLTNQSVSDLKKINLQKIILQLDDQGWIFPEQPSFSIVGSCKFCMMRFLLYIEYSCYGCNRKYVFCSKVCHYQFLLQHCCKQAAHNEIINIYGQEYIQQETNISKINTQPNISQILQANISGVKYDYSPPFDRKKSESKETFGGGMVNIGNTCYLNSSLQNLIRTKLSQQLIKIESKIKSSKTCKLAKAYLTLINKLKNTSSSNYISYRQMQDFKLVVNKQISLFDDYQQHDAHEFIMFFLDRLSEELNLNRNITQSLNTIQSKNTNETAARNEWFKFISKNNSPIIHLFYGQIQTQIDCPHCHTVNQTFDSFNILSISIPNKLQSYTVSLFYESYLFKDRVKFVKMDVQGHLMGDLIKSVTEALSLPSYKKSLVKGFITGFENNVVEVNNNESIPTVLDKLQKFGSKQNQLFLFEMPSNPSNYLIFKFIIQNNSITMKKALFFTQGKDRIRNFKIYQTVIDYLLNLAALYMSKNEEQKNKTEELKKRIQVSVQKYFKIEINVSEQSQVKKQSIYISPNTQIQPQLMLNCQIWVHIQNFSVNSPKEKQFFDIVKDKLKIFKKATELKTPTKLDIDQTPQTIQQCLRQQFNRKQLLDNQNKWHCSTCNQKRRVHQITHLYKTNKYLFIHLKRFTKADSGDYYKNQNKVKVSLQLDLTDILTNPTLPQNYYQHLPQPTLINYHLPTQINTKESHRYKLIGLILHKGNMGSGHYTALFDNEGWWLYNDQTTKSVNIQTLLDLTITMEKIYILLYQRIG